MFQFRTKENANDPLGDVQYTYGRLEQTVKRKETLVTRAQEVQYADCTRWLLRIFPVVPLL